MKKTFVLLSLVSFLTATVAHAKTQGHYLGIDVLQTTAKMKTRSTATGDVNLGQWYEHKKRKSHLGMGLNYKYAFNFNDFFVAPGLSYDLIDNELHAGFNGTNNDPFSESIKFKNRASAQVNFGYDISSKFAVYIPVGVSTFRYQIKTLDVSGATRIHSNSNGNVTATFAGLGISYQPIKQLAVSLEYNRFENMKIVSERATFNNGRIRANVEVEMVKLGIAYNF